MRTLKVIAIVAFCISVVVAFTFPIVYMLIHPELAEPQIFLKFWYCLLYGIFGAALALLFKRKGKIFNDVFNDTFR